LPRFDWSEESLRRGVREADAVVHLAGENLFAKRWTAAQKRLLVASRVENTRRLAALVAERRSASFLCASAIGFYGASETETFDERSPRGSDFLAELCGAWEQSTEAAVRAGVRTVNLRIGVVLGHGGGALANMLPIFRLGLGGPLGNGRQWMSWIHLEDLCALVEFLLGQEGAHGAWNATAPTPVTMNEFARTLGKTLHRPAFFRAPAPILRLALGEVADVLLTGQRVLPRRALEAGFSFVHPELVSALRAL
jgi:uncharacterized protein (TIGR01777 family)